MACEIVSDVLYIIWSCIAGMQQASWWSWKGVVGKVKFSATGKKHGPIIGRWNINCLWIPPVNFQFNISHASAFSISSCIYMYSTINFPLRGCIPLWVISALSYLINTFCLFLFLHVCLHHLTLPSSHTVVFCIQYHHEFKVCVITLCVWYNPCITDLQMTYCLMVNLKQAARL